MYTVTKMLPTGAWQKITACHIHLPETMKELGGVKFTVDDVTANAGLYTCMGCLKGWPAVRVQVTLPTVRTGDTNK
jgi:hypothetical protein